MDCRAAQHLISAERDRTLPAGERASLEAHVAVCPTCRQAREVLAASAAAWQRADRAAAIPPVETAWHDIRRAIRNSAPAGRRASSWWMRAVWAGVPALGAAALAMVVWMRPVQPKDDLATVAASWSQFVEVDASVTPPVVTVDESSGWVIVWAGDSDAGKS